MFDDIWSACRAWASDLVRWHRAHHARDWPDRLVEHEPLVTTMVAAALYHVAHAQGHDDPDGAFLYRVPLQPVLDRLAATVPREQQDMVDQAASIAGSADGALEELRTMWRGGGEAITTRWQIAELARDVMARHLARPPAPTGQAPMTPTTSIQDLLEQLTALRLADRVIDLVPGEQARVLLAAWRVADRPPPSPR